MNKLLRIELFKVRHNRASIVLMILFGLFLVSVPIASKAFLDFLARQGEQAFNTSLPISRLPIFDFVDLWQNLTYIYTWASILLGFIIIISVCNEFNHGTIKQHVIDGLSRQGLLWTKVSFIITSSAAVTLAVFAIGLIMGFMWSPVKEFVFIIKNLEFLLAYFFHLIGFQMLCLFAALLIKRSGLTIAFMIFYVMVIEPIITSLIAYYYKLEWLADLFPVRAISNIIRVPFGKYIMQESVSTVQWMDAIILSLYIGLLYFLAHRMMTKRDLA